MASRRFVDRGFWKCRELNKADARTRLLFVYLFGEEADDFGRIKDDPYLMRRGCFSDDDVSESEVAAMLDALVDAGLVKRYLARDESPLLWLPTFHDYQPMGYWALSRLDRHPEDDFEAFDWIGPRGKKVKTNRELSPAGHEYRILHNPTQSDEGCRNPTKVDVPIPIPIPMPARAGAPVGRRAEPDAGTSLEASAANSRSGDADAAAPYGRGTDAPTSGNGTDSGHDAFEQADSPADAGKAYRLWKSQTGAWNGSDGLLPRRQSEGRARDLVMSYEGRVGLIATTIDCGGWKSLAKALGRSGPAPPGEHEARAQAKQMLEQGMDDDHMRS